MAINSYSIRPPARPVGKSYVPPGGVQHPVKTGDSWVTLAQPIKMSPWDLIRYNYPGLPADVQAAAKEVNWYLQQYVGCTKVTSDGRNYEFSTGDTPGKIWIPRGTVPVPTPTATVLSPDEVARKQVLAALRDPAVGRMNFGVGRVFIIAHDYERVAKAIESGAITVHVDSRLAAHMAEYWSGAGPTALDKANSFAVPPGGSDPSLLIHEATHAIFDIQNRPSYTNESEALAYVAQALFSRIKYGPPSARYIVSQDPAHVISWIAWQAIFDQASLLAEILITTKPPYVTEDQAKLLYWAIGNTITYINQGPNTSYDGVAGA
jgi:hypothetical protein